MTTGTWGQGLLWPGGLVSSDADVCSHFPLRSGGRTLPRVGPVASAWTPSLSWTPTSSSPASGPPTSLVSSSSSKQRPETMEDLGDGREKGQRSQGVC